MIVKEVQKGFLHFLFPEQPGFVYGFNIYCFIQGQRALVIDTAFRTQIRQVVEYLGFNGVSIDSTVISHFHNDHVAGLMALPGDVRVLGSPDYRKTLSKDLPQTVTAVDFQEPYRFGRFSFRFIPAPGHSPCSIFTVIDDSYLHAGDCLMSRYDGRGIVPWVKRKHIPVHITSLEKLRGMKGKEVLLSHGPALKNAEEIKKEADRRIHYLEAVLKPNVSSVEQALPDSLEKWAGEDHFQQLMDSSSDRK